MMKAYQIVIKGNEISEEYARISRASFKPLTENGIIDIETFDAITPESPEFEEHKSRYNWQKSLMKGDMGWGGGKDIPMHSPTEIAGMCSHWELMRRQSQTKDMFLVLEHDTWFIDDHHHSLEYFRQLTKMKVNYLNIGLFMGCYGFEQKTAQYQYEMLSKRGFPINCGPYCVLNRLFQTYTTRYLQTVDFENKPFTAVHPWHHCDTLYLGNNVREPFNTPDPLRHANRFPTPTTQVIKKSLKVTQDHHSYNDKQQNEPWTRHHLFKIIE